MRRHSHISRFLVVSVLVCMATADIFTFSSPTVETADGKLRGKYVLTREGKKVRAFLGIPYAKPPVDELRFKNPVPVEPWDNERWALDHPKPCVQPERRHGEPVGCEDCLYLNVYTPEGLMKPKVPNFHTRWNKTMENIVTRGDDMSNAVPDSEATVNGTEMQATAVNASVTRETDLMGDPSGMSCPLLPVMVFLHGGSFEMGHSEPFTHEYLLDGGVIVVTVQYRLGILGFFSTGDEVLPGNLGFKDQRLALKWVQENIEHFGGCPEKITIFGDGAGGASVHYHMIFPTKSPPFRAGISMSGTALSPWAFHSPTEVNQTAARIAKLSGCPRQSRELVECLQKKPAEDFVKLLQKYKNETRGGCGEWAQAVPVLGGVLENSTSEGAFITENPWDKKVNLPWTVGVTSKEMLYEFTPHLVDRRDRLFKQLDKCFNETLPKVLGLQYSQANGSGLAAAVRSFYFRDLPMTRDILQYIVDAVSDGSVVYPTFEAVRRANRRTTWLYHFDFIGTNTYGPTALDGRIAPGRGDDLFFFFPRPLGKNIPRKNKDPDTAMSRKLVQMWTNFAANLDPTPNPIDDVKWAPIVPSTAYLNIGQEKMTMERPFLDYRMNFWSMQGFPHRDDEYGDETATITPEPANNPSVKRA